MTTEIRNFAIVAHVDHGKSTLSDRIIERSLDERPRVSLDQMLDSLELERERGITIKAQTVCLHYRASDGGIYTFNLIDTPGHVDFSYEVSRALAACEGVILLVDATQGIEAQTLANVYLAMEQELPIIPVVNKIDLPAAETGRVAEEIENLLGISTLEILYISSKTGEGVDILMESIVRRIPPPKLTNPGFLRALLVDSWYDAYMGILVLVRVFQGALKPKQAVTLKSSGRTYIVDYTAVMTPTGRAEVSVLGVGEVGVIQMGIKDVAGCRVGDTLVDSPETPALPGFKTIHQVVFCGFFLSEGQDFSLLQTALNRLHLNDPSYTYEKISSNALGLGFRCGFLGLLHLDIVRERLEREFDLDLITTAPTVLFHLYEKDGQYKELYDPSELPDPTRIERLEEPWVLATIVVPEVYLGNTIALCHEKRGVERALTYLGKRVMTTYELPLNEIVFDFYDRLKSLSRGYASFDYEPLDYRTGDIVKVNILINGEVVEPFSMLLHRSRSTFRGREVCARLKALIPRQLFAIPIQAAIGGKIIARETVSALRKDVTAKCYGGDITRKRKLLEKQKAGKKKMRAIGHVQIPNNVFLDALKMKER